MKAFLRLLTFGLLAPLFLTSCDLEDPAPANPSAGPVYLTRAASSAGDERQFVYNGQGWLTQIKGKGSYALNDAQESTSNILFDNWSRLAYVLTKGTAQDAENVYHYTSDNLVYKIEELVDGRVESYHTFEYDAKKLLKTRYDFSKNADSDSETPLATHKEVYTYETGSGNVILVESFQKAGSALDWQLVQMQKYTDYDAKIGVQHMLGFLFTPTIVLHRNNPGKVTTTLANGEQHVTTFTYEYNDRNLPTKRITTSEQGSPVETTFTYQF
ncbi:hypothetical protein GU926_11450 [Nibribacter ruber]|uniref:DUF4595 domain-containing protein n=1 Tax=Nibribacter ruber TaxID=2698458 RepID=A0A6P1NYA1_9BACT|nr:hypothetical protein [Nibribacter ruber]QHL88010.1 hypothetical protein GU926_11450 [Nibribacter ruber]